MEQPENDIERSSSESREPLALGTSPSGLPAVEIEHASEEEQKIVRRIMVANRSDDPEYHLRKKCEAFLQGDQEGWMEIEFWNQDTKAQQAFVDYLNEQLGRK